MDRYDRHVLSRTGVLVHVEGDDYDSLDGSCSELESHCQTGLQGTWKFTIKYLLFKLGVDSKEIFINFDNTL